MQRVNITNACREHFFPPYVHTYSHIQHHLELYSISPSHDRPHPTKRFCQRHTIHDRRNRTAENTSSWSGPRARWKNAEARNRATGKEEQRRIRRAGSSTAWSFEPQSSRTCLDAPCWLEVRAPGDATSSMQLAGVMLGTNGHHRRGKCIESTLPPRPPG